MVRSSRKNEVNVEPSKLVVAEVNLHSGKHGMR